MKSRKVIVGYDSWKRPIVRYVEDKSDSIPQQLSLNFKPREATPEEVEKWQTEHLQPLGDAQLPFIAVMAVVQFLALATMMLSFYLIGLWANG